MEDIPRKGRTWGMSHGQGTRASFMRGITVDSGWHSRAGSSGTDSKTGSHFEPLSVLLEAFILILIPNLVILAPSCSPSHKSSGNNFHYLQPNFPKEWTLLINSTSWPSQFVLQTTAVQLRPHHATKILAHNLTAKPPSSYRFAPLLGLSCHSYHAPLPMNLSSPGFFHTTLSLWQILLCNLQVALPPSAP